ncbi:hypothetical protein CEXT_703791 [Caerostris extrusa]|uniref:UspA domain-containing protein n=1 Tax=Caerostris extrusa TaxID=172846 RepID=A0AAV4P9Y6_CAEEX|nr:hypothetical protein CEXT_703791 [Caerostris extrusa]
MKYDDAEHPPPHLLSSTPFVEGAAKFVREENFSCVLVGKKSSGAGEKEGEWERSGLLEKAWRMRCAAVAMVMSKSASPAPSGHSCFKLNYTKMI